MAKSEPKRLVLIAFMAILVVAETYALPLDKETGTPQHGTVSPHSLGILKLVACVSGQVCVFTKENGAQNVPLIMVGYEVPNIGSPCPAEVMAAIQSRNALANMLLQADKVSVQLLAFQFPGPSRAYVSVDGLDVGERLIRSGHAWRFGSTAPRFNCTRS